MCSRSDRLKADSCAEENLCNQIARQKSFTVLQELSNESMSDEVRDDLSLICRDRQNLPKGSAQRAQPWSTRQMEQPGATAT
jgi:hypothetical protein